MLRKSRGVAFLLLARKTDLSKEKFHLLTVYTIR